MSAVPGSKSRSRIASTSTSTSAPRQASRRGEPRPPPPGNETVRLRGSTRSPSPVHFSTASFAVHNRARARAVSAAPAAAPAAGADSLARAVSSACPSTTASNPARETSATLSMSTPTGPRKVRANATHPTVRLRLTCSGRVPVPAPGDTATSGRPWSRPPQCGQFRSMRTRRGSTPSAQAAAAARNRRSSASVDPRGATTMKTSPARSGFTTPNLPSPPVPGQSACPVSARGRSVREPAQRAARPVRHW